MKVRRSLLKSVALVETYAGDGAYGPVYAPAVSVPCAVDSRHRLVRNGNGDEVMAETVVIVHPEDASSFTPESRLTIDGRASTVISVGPLALRGSTSHIEVTCS